MQRRFPKLATPYGRGRRGAADSRDGLVLTPAPLLDEGRSGSARRARRTLARPEFAPFASASSASLPRLPPARRQRVRLGANRATRRPHSTAWSPPGRRAWSCSCATANGRFGSRMGFRT